MADTIYTIEDSARAKLKLGTSAAPSFISAAEFAGWVLRFAISQQQSHNLVRLAAGYWMYQGKLSLLTPTFTGVPDVTYTVYACGERDGGPAAMKSGGTGTDPANPFVLTGIPVDYSRLMAALIRHIAATKLDEYAQSVSGGSVSPQSVYDQMMKGARYYDGAFGI
jgi:hypothetical protein